MKRTAVVAFVACTFAFPVAAQDASATATLTDQSGASIGTLTLVDMEGGIHISGNLTGVPNGDHGFHIHEVGVCDATAKFETAGPHFNPAGKKHGSENPEGPHAGDLTNVTADDDGNAAIDVHSAGATIGDGVASINDADGAAIILHAEADDYETDPSGNSGDRLACGVIEFSAPATTG